MKKTKTVTCNYSIFERYYKSYVNFIKQLLIRCHKFQFIEAFRSFSCHFSDFKEEMLITGGNTSKEKAAPNLKSRFRCFLIFFSAEEVPGNGGHADQRDQLGDAPQQDILVWIRGLGTGRG